VLHIDLGQSWKFGNIDDNVHILYILRVCIFHLLLCI